MLEWKKPQLSDRDWINACLAHANSMNCEYCFGNLFIWKDSYATEVTHYKDFMICRWGRGTHISYSLPLGEGDFTDAVRQIIADARLLGVRARIYGITSGYLMMLQEAFLGEFTYQRNDAFSDYIYLTEKMASLSGKKLHAKRNHIANFKKNYPDWRFERITRESIPECLALHRKWLENRDSEDQEDYDEELEAVTAAFENFEALSLVGGLIRVSGEVIAYTLGEKEPGCDCFVTHFEKADADIQGAYAIINQEFTRECLTEYKYVNREEDLGLEGLRKAKRSYHPEILLEKCVAVYND